MNLRLLSDDELHQTTIEVASKERKATLETLHHLREVERRRLYSKFGCSSLHAYCVKVLKFSEPQAGRRVSASRLLKELPAIEEKMLDGSLNLTNVAQAAVFFSKEKRAGHTFNSDEKLDLISSLESTSTRKADQILMAKSVQPEIHLRESIKPKTVTHTEVKLYFDQETVEALDRLKEIWSNAMPNANLAMIIKRMAVEAVDRHDPLNKAERSFARAKRKVQPLEQAHQTKQSLSRDPQTDEPLARDQRPDESLAQTGNAALSHGFSEIALFDESEVATSKQSKAQNQTQNRALDLNSTSVEDDASEVARHAFTELNFVVVSSLNTSTPKRSSIKHEVRRRDQDRCTFVDPATSVRCESRHFIEEDHIIPKAMGGEYSVENIRLRCRAHNQRHAIETYGFEKMSRYFGDLH